MKKKDVFMPADIIVSGDSKEDWYHGSNTPVIFSCHAKWMAATYIIFGKIMNESKGG